MGQQGWIGVDLDGTLAHYDHWRGVGHIGAPILRMVRRVQRWLFEGKDVRIFTARISAGGKEGAAALDEIQHWCHQHIGQVLPVTCCKDFDMVELWDDRCVQVEPNTARRVDGEVG